MNLAPTVRTALLQAMIDSLSLDAVQQLTSDNREILNSSYDDCIPSAIGLNKGLSRYIDELEKLSTVTIFIFVLCNKFPGNASVKKLKDEFDKTYTSNEGKNSAYCAAFLDSILLENLTLPFIGRSEVKVKIQQMLNKRTARFSLIKGGSRMGRSYLQHYFSDVATRTNGFELVTVDLAYVHNEYCAPDEPLWGSQLAAYLTGRLGLDADVDPNSKATFKHTPCTGLIRNYLKEQNRKCLFYFDQFESITPSQDLFPFIYAVADLSLGGNGQENFAILSGASPNNLGLIPFALKSLLSQGNIEVNLPEFSEEQVDAFFFKYYHYLSSEVGELEMTLEDFLANIHSKVIVEDDYKSPNVERIGLKVRAWYDQNKP